MGAPHEGPRPGPRPARSGRVDRASASSASARRYGFSHSTCLPASSGADRPLARAARLRQRDVDGVDLGIGRAAPRSCRGRAGRVGLVGEAPGRRLASREPTATTCAPARMSSWLIAAVERGPSGASAHAQRRAHAERRDGPRSCRRGRSGRRASRPSPLADLARPASRRSRRRRRPPTRSNARSCGILAAVGQLHDRGARLELRAREREVELARLDEQARRARPRGGARRPRARAARARAARRASSHAPAAAVSRAPRPARRAGIDAEPVARSSDE